jgi:hypothetical protein
MGRNAPFRHYSTSVDRIVGDSYPLSFYELVRVRKVLEEKGESIPIILQERSARAYFFNGFFVIDHDRNSLTTTEPDFTFFCDNARGLEEIAGMFGLNQSNQHYESNCEK